MDVLVITEDAGKSGDLRKGKQGNRQGEKQCREMEARENRRIE
jgi:hypothetical protein